MPAVSTNYVLPVIPNDSPDTCTVPWTPTTLTGAPAGRYRHTAVWTGSEMVVWGGYAGFGFSYFNTGGRYNPSTDTWTVTSTTNAPDGRYDHTAVWTGSEMIIWGGAGTTPFGTNTGGRYNPAADSWTATSTVNAPAGRSLHTAVWTGSEMIVWGGDSSSGIENTGGRYNPSTDSWTATSTTNVPAGRSFHTAVWTGSKMIVWGGMAPDLPELYTNTGGKYNPGTDSWTATNTTSAPTGRFSHTAVWTGSDMIVWGGTNIGSYFRSGGRYNPSTDSWTATSTTGAPVRRAYHTSVWRGSEMIIWGGYFNDGTSHYLNTGGRYNAGTDSWTATSTTGAAEARYLHKAVRTATEMIVWGGYNGVSAVNTGGRYCPAAPTSTPTPTPTPTATHTPTPTPTASPTPTPTPCTERCTPTPRPRPTPAPRPTS